MEIKLSKEESMEIFHTSMCNGLGWIEGYGIELTYSSNHYELASKKIKNPSHEDVLQQILEDGNPIIFYDIESGETFPVYLKDVYTKVSKTDSESLLNLINENDDAMDADCVLQTVAFGEVIFG